jgi:rRNA maturation RNase YbeY
MINFYYETDFKLGNEEAFFNWISGVIISEKHLEGTINYIFCDDEYLHKINVEYLNHDDLTDIISFDYSERNTLNGDFFISIERVKDNAKDFKVAFDEELKRVVIHGVLHCCGYKDKTDSDALLMRQKEDEKIKMFHVEHN